MVYGRKELASDYLRMSVVKVNVFRTREVLTSHVARCYAATEPLRATSPARYTEVVVSFVLCTNKDFMTENVFKNANIIILYINY